VAARVGAGALVGAAVAVPCAGGIVAAALAGAVGACVSPLVGNAAVVEVAAAAASVKTTAATLAAAELAAGAGVLGWHPAAAVNALTSIRQTCHGQFLNINAFLRGTIS